MRLFQKKPQFSFYDYLFRQKHKSEVHKNQALEHLVAVCSPQVNFKLKLWRLQGDISSWMSRHMDFRDMTSCKELIIIKFYKFNHNSSKIACLFCRIYIFYLYILSFHWFNCDFGAHESCNFFEVQTNFLEICSQLFYARNIYTKWLFVIKIASMEFYE